MSEQDLSNGRVDRRTFLKMLGSAGASAAIVSVGAPRFGSPSVPPGQMQPPMAPYDGLPPQIMQPTPAVPPGFVPPLSPVPEPEKATQRGYNPQWR